MYPPQADGRSLDLSTEDGVRIHANMEGRGNRGVLLVHGRDRSSVVWKLFVEKLVAKGIRVLTIDLRGHGESDRPAKSDDEMYPPMLKDVQAGLKALNRYELKSISIVGADLGANLALQVAAQDASVDNLILLSPGFNIKGHKATSPLGQYGARPVLLAAANGDDYSKKTVTYLKSKAQGKSKLHLAEGNANGARLLEENPNLEDSVIQWLEGKFDEGGANTTEQVITTGGVEKMESTGKSFGE